jgi:prevent-host-death family protein
MDLGLHEWQADSQVSRRDRLNEATGRVSVRELRNNGGAVLDKVARGEVVVVTRDGAEAAELHSRRRLGLSAAELIARRRSLWKVDPDGLRQDVDELIDQTL